MRYPHFRGNHIEIANGSWLVVSIPLKNMSSSVGMMKFPIYGKIKAMFQTTNQAAFTAVEQPFPLCRDHV